MMSFMGNKCIEQVDSQGLGKLLDLSFLWVAGREFRKAYETKEELAKWDSECRDIGAKLAKGKDEKLNLPVMGDKQKAFLQAIVSFMLKSPTCPGWSNSTCSMDWGEFACFCSAAAKTLTNEQIKELGATQPAGEPIQYTCDPSIKSDPIYSTTTTTPLVKSESQTSWTKWVLGGAAVLGLGALGYVLASKKPSSNPSRSADIEISDWGTIISATPLTARGRKWLARNSGWKSGTLDFEHRYGMEMIEGALGDSLSVADTRTGKLLALA